MTQTVGADIWALAVQPSPLHHRTSEFNRTNDWTTEFGRTVPRIYDTIEMEYAALRNSCGIADLAGLPTYVVRGEDAGPFLDRLAGGCGGHVEIGHSRYVALSDETAGLIGDGLVMRPDQEEWFLTLPMRCLDWLLVSAQGMQCTVEDVSDTVCTFAVEGPSACAALLASGFGGLEALRPGAVRKMKIASAEVLVARVSATGGLGYEIRCGLDDALFLYDRVFRLSALFRPRPVGVAARNVARIEAGHPKLGVDYQSSRTCRSDELRTALEVGLGRFIDMDAGVFTGRGALQQGLREGPSYSLVGLLIEGSDLPSAATLFLSDRAIGKITSVAWSPARKRIIALADVEAGILGNSAQLTATGPGGGRFRGHIVPRPFYTCPNARRTPPEAS